MNKKDVLIGAVAGVILLLAGLWVGLSLNGSSSSSSVFGAIASKWTNFGNSGVTTKVGYAITSADNSTTSVQIAVVTTTAGSFGISYITVGGSAATTLNITTSTTLPGSFDCLYDTINQTTSTGAVTLTLPSATTTAANCLAQDGTWDIAEIEIAPGNAFNMTIATSGTGDIVAYNGTSTAGALTLATSSSGSFYELKSYRFGSNVLYTIANMGSGH